MRIPPPDNNLTFNFPELGFHQTYRQLNSPKTPAATPKPNNKNLIPDEQWNDWQWHVRNRILSAAELAQWATVSDEEKQAIDGMQGRFHFSATPYWASLMAAHNPQCPIRRQTIPDIAFESPSLSDPTSHLSSAQPLCFHGAQAILRVHSRCIVYCRFCPQRTTTNAEQSALASSPMDPFSGAWDAIIERIQERPILNEIIMTGGEPLLFNDLLLTEILNRLHRARVLVSLRIETRMLSVLPQRITSTLADILGKFPTLTLMLHVNHAKEITHEFECAVRRLRKRDVPLVSQTVLLKNVNDSLRDLKLLFQKLHHLRVRPMQLIHPAPTTFTQPTVTFNTGLSLMQRLRLQLPDICLPQYVLDTPDGKVPIQYETIVARNHRRVLIKSFDGKIHIFPE